MFLAYCINWSIGVGVTVWTFYLEHRKVDVVCEWF